MCVRACVRACVRVCVLRTEGAVYVPHNNRDSIKRYVLSYPEHLDTSQLLVLTGQACGRASLDEARI